MSYDVSLLNAEPVERFIEGGTYAVSGSTQPELNITYNYSEVYRLFDFSIRESLHGKRAGDMIPTLEKIIEKCGTNRFKDYWAPTPGNAGYALSILLGWAKQYPDAVFDVY